MMKLARGTILLVADGSQMMVLRNDGDTIAPKLTVMKQQAIESLPNRAILSDAPGVGFASAGVGRDTYDKADPHQENEDRFVAGAAEVLSAIAEDEKGDLIIVAPPTALGVLRKHYSKTIEERLLGEIAKDFTNHPVDEIARLTMAHQIHS